MQCPDYSDRELATMVRNACDGMGSDETAEELHIPAREVAAVLANLEKGLAGRARNGKPAPKSNKIGRPRSVTLEQEERIEELASQGVTQREIVIAVGCTDGAVRHVLAVARDARATDG